jgi:general secretion pathway protein D
MVLADARTNSLIIRAPNAARATLARTLIAKLDQPTALPGNVHVVYLRNAEATKLAQVLRAVVASESATGPSMVTSQVSITPMQPAPGAAPGGALQTSSVSSQSTQAPLPTGGTAGFIQADPSTNTLIITANERVYRNLRVIIDQLDARRAQVYVESLIVEISADTAAPATTSTPRRRDTATVVAFVRRRRIVSASGSTTVTGSARITATHREEAR